MKTLVVLCFLALVGCTQVPRGATKIPTLLHVAEAIHFRTSVADIAMTFSEVEAELRASSFAPDERDRFVRLLSERRTQEYFTQVWPEDAVGYAIAEAVLPVLLPRGRVVVTDLQSMRVSVFIWSGWAPRGQIGPYFCLPDGREFFRQTVFIE